MSAAIDQGVHWKGLGKTWPFPLRKVLIEGANSLGS